MANSKYVLVIHLEDIFVVSSRPELENTGNTKIHVSIKKKKPNSKENQYLNSLDEEEEIV
jgi:hypothetical protein